MKERGKSLKAPMVCLLNQRLMPSSYQEENILFMMMILMMIALEITKLFLIVEFLVCVSPVLLAIPF